MELFKSIQKYFAIVGISSHQSVQRYPILNARSLICTFLFILAIIGLVVYTVFLANHFEEYTDCVITTGTTFVLATLFGINIGKMKKMFQSITAIENLIQKSKRT